MKVLYKLSIVCLVGSNDILITHIHGTSLHGRPIMNGISWLMWVETAYLLYNSLNLLSFNSTSTQLALRILAILLTLKVYLEYLQVYTVMLLFFWLSLSSTSITHFLWSNSYLSHLFWVKYELILVGCKSSLEKVFMFDHVLKICFDVLLINKNLNAQVVCFPVLVSTVFSDGGGIQ